SHAVAYYLLAVLGTLAQPTLQLRQRRRQNEYADHIITAVGDELPRSLPVNVEQHVDALIHCGLYRHCRRAILMVKHRGVLQQIASGDHLRKPGAVDEKIILALDLSRPHWTCRHRNRHGQPVMAAEQTPRKRRLARTRRRRENEHEAPA